MYLYDFSLLMQQTQGSQCVSMIELICLSLTINTCMLCLGGFFYTLKHVSHRTEALSVQYKGLVIEWGSRTLVDPNYTGMSVFIRMGLERNFYHINSPAFLRSAVDHLTW